MKNKKIESLNASMKVLREEFSKKKVDGKRIKERLKRVKATFGTIKSDYVPTNEDLRRENLYDPQYGTVITTLRDFIQATQGLDMNTPLESIEPIVGYVNRIKELEHQIQEMKDDAQNDAWERDLMDS